MEAKTDTELVDLARSGNRDAYGELIRRYQHSIWGLACLLVNDRYEAQDLTQEAFLRAWLNLDLLSDPAKFAPWLRRIVFGVSIDWLRVFRPDLYRLPDVKTELELSGQSAHSESALEKLQAIEMRQRIWDAVGRLPPRYRLPLTLFHLDGLSHSKVAEALGVPVSTVRSLVTRARQKLQPMLAAYAAEVLPALEDVFREQTIGEWSMLHITDGESVAGTLRKSGVPGVVSIYGDLMNEGPAPAGLDDQAWFDVRARFLAEVDYGTLDLFEARHPLVRITRATERRLDDITLTETGRDVLEGRADHIALNGVDVWLGGVHLKGDKATWRWDRASGRIVCHQ